MRIAKNAYEHTGSAEAVRPSLRNGFNGFLRALLGDRSFVATVPCGWLRKLDASLGASGPHDLMSSRFFGLLITPEVPENTGFFRFLLG